MDRIPSLHLIGLSLCLGALAFAYLYLERTLGLEPCPLCVLDRFLFGTLAVVFAFAWLRNPDRRDRIGYDIGALGFCIGGLGVAGRHVYLQHAPAESLAECGAGFWDLMEQIGIEGAVASALRGDGDCGDIQWTFLGLSIPTLTLILFAVLFLITLVDIILAIRSKPMPGF